MESDGFRKLTVWLREYCVFRHEVLHFDTWCMIASLICAFSYVLSRLEVTVSVVNTVAVVGLFLFLRSLVSLREKLFIVKSTADRIRNLYNTSGMQNPDIMLYDAGEANRNSLSRSRSCFDIVFFGTSFYLGIAALLRS